MNDYRIEKDAIGELEVPLDVYWGINTQRAVMNFQISGKKFPNDFIHALAQVKKACLIANKAAKLVSQEIFDALETAIDEVIEAIPEPEEPESERVVISADMPVTDLEIDNVSSRQLAAIVEAGVETVGELFDEADALEAVDGIGKATKLRILEAVTAALENQ